MNAWFLVLIYLAPLESDMPAGWLQMPLGLYSRGTFTTYEACKERAESLERTLNEGRHGMETVKVLRCLPFDAEHIGAKWPPGAP